MNYHAYMKKLCFICFFAVIVSSSAIALPLELNFPAACKANTDCWIIHSDEKGTDIALKSIKEMDKGVPVLAAEYGNVILINNDQKDETYYGNSVVIEHRDGWKTIYTHLKPGSIIVKEGRRVRKGDKIAEIGMSGKVYFPQLRFMAFKDGELQIPLWETRLKKEIKAQDFVVANMGIAEELPLFEKVREDSYENTELYNDAGAVYLWVYGFNFKKGDLLKFSAQDPQNERILNQAFLIDRNFEENFYNIKIEKTDDSFKPGEYTAKMEFIRPVTGIAKEYSFGFNLKEPFNVELAKQQKEQKELEDLRAQRRRRILLYKKLQGDAEKSAVKIASESNTNTNQGAAAAKEAADAAVAASEALEKAKEALTKIKAVSEYKKAAEAAKTAQDAAENAALIAESAEKAAEAAALEAAKNYNIGKEKATRAAREEAVLAAKAAADAAKKSSVDAKTSAEAAADYAAEAAKIVKEFEE